MPWSCMWWLSARAQSFSLPSNQFSHRMLGERLCVWKYPRQTNCLHFPLLLFRSASFRSTYWLVSECAMTCIGDCCWFLPCTNSRLERKQINRKMEDERISKAEAQWCLRFSCSIHHLLSCSRPKNGTQQETPIQTSVACDWHVFIRNAMRPLL